MEYCYVVPQEDELKHYGVKGMHWGIRRYQPYPDGKHGEYLNKRQARKTIRNMNQNAYTYALASHYKDRSAKRAMKRMMKAEVADVKGKIKKRDRLTRKAQNELKDVGFHQNTMMEAKKAIDESIKRLDAGGWSVMSRDRRTMLTAAGKRTVKDIMFGMHLDRARMAGIPALLASPKGNVRSYSAFQKPLFKKTPDGRMIAINKSSEKIANKSNEEGRTLSLAKDESGRITTLANKILTNHNSDQHLPNAHDTLTIKPPKGYENVKQIAPEKKMLSMVDVKKRKRK